MKTLEPLTLKGRNVMLKPQTQIAAIESLGRTQEIAAKLQENGILKQAIGTCMSQTVEFAKQSGQPLIPSGNLKPMLLREQAITADLMTRLVAGDHSPETITLLDQSLAINGEILIEVHAILVALESAADVPSNNQRAS